MTNYNFLEVIRKKESHMFLRKCYILGYILFVFSILLHNLELVLDVGRGNEPDQPGPFCYNYIRRKSGTVQITLSIIRNKMIPRNSTVIIKISEVLYRETNKFILKK